jgi:hypothetical protein
MSREIREFNIERQTAHTRANAFKIRSLFPLKNGFQTGAEVFTFYTRSRNKILRNR